MMKKIFYELPTLYDAKGQTDKDWHIAYKEWDENSNKLERVKKYGKLNRLPVEERYAEAKSMIAEFTKYLEEKFPDQEGYVKTLAEHIADICRSKQDLKDKSAATYRVFKKDFTEFLEKNKMLKLLAPNFKVSHAFAYMDHVSDKAEVNSNTTWNNYRNFMKVYFIELENREIIKVNPFRKIRLKPATEKTHVPFTPSQQKALAKLLWDRFPNLYLFCSLVFYCFIRPGEEIRNLKLKDIDWDQRQIRVRGSYAKNNTTQFVKIPEEFYNFLMRHFSHYKEMDQELYMFGHDLTPRKCKVHKDDPTKWHKEFLLELNIPTGDEGCTLYSWKHTGAIRAVQSGINLKDLQLQLRHASLDQVDKYLRGLGMLPSNELENKFPSMESYSGLALVG